MLFGVELLVIDVCPDLALAHAVFAEHDVERQPACYLDEMSEFVPPHEAARTAEDPDAYLLRFLQSTYEAAAELANWESEILEGEATPL